LTVNVGNEISLEEQMNLICIYLYGEKKNESLGNGDFFITSEK
jgi:hypothetical protein